MHNVGWGCAEILPSAHLKFTLYFGGDPPMIGEESHLKESPPTHEIVTDTTQLCRLKTSDSQSKGFPQ